MCHRVYVPGTGPDHKTVELVGEQVPQCVGRAILSFAVLSLWLKQWVVVGVRIIVVVEVKKVAKSECNEEKRTFLY